MYIRYDTVSTSMLILCYNHHVEWNMGMFFLRLKSDSHVLLSTDWLCMRSHQVGVRWMMMFMKELFLPICWTVTTQHEQRYVSHAIDMNKTLDGFFCVCDLTVCLNAGP